MSIAAACRRSTPLLTLLLGLAGCASTGPGPTGADRAADALTTTEKLSLELAELRGELAQVRASIHHVNESVASAGMLDRTKVAKGDVEAAFGGYRKAVDSLAETGDEVEDRVARLGDQLDVYAESWRASTASIASTSLREASMKRSEDASQRFGQAMGDLKDFWQRYETFERNLGDVELALSNDLTPAGIDAIKGDLSKLAEESATLEEATRTASDRLEVISQSLRANDYPLEG